MERRGLRVVRAGRGAGACVMAAVTGLLTDAPGVAVVAVDDVEGQVLAALEQARRDGAPLVAVTDRAFGIPVEGTVKASLIVTADAAAHWSAHACQLALTEPRGPVHLVVAPGTAVAPAVPLATAARPAPLAVPDPVAARRRRGSPGSGAAADPHRRAAVPHARGGDVAARAGRVVARTRPGDDSRQGSPSRSTSAESRADRGRGLSRCHPPARGSRGRGRPRPRGAGARRAAGIAARPPPRRVGVDASGGPAADGGPRRGRAPSSRSWRPGCAVALAPTGTWPSWIVSSARSACRRGRPARRGSCPSPRWCGSRREATPAGTIAVVAADEATDADRRARGRSWRRVSCWCRVAGLPGFALPAALAAGARAPSGSRDLLRERRSGSPRGGRAGHGRPPRPSRPRPARRRRR